MRKQLAIIVLVSLLLSGCGLGFGRRLLGGGGTRLTAGTELPPTATSTESPTNTPVPTATMTLVPTPDPVSAGLPAEAPGTNALDFVGTMCQATWYTRAGNLPCPGDANNSDAGLVMRWPGNEQGLEPNFPVMLLYPPQDNSETIFSRYPAFTIQKGDRFRAVLECRSHSFCDVEFDLSFDSASGSGRVANWPYRFTQPAVVVDYPLDGLAGLTVQFDLSLRGVGNRIDSYGVYLFPHIYRPGS
jgi:hypothetical protein